MYAMHSGWTAQPRDTRILILAGSGRPPVAHGSTAGWSPLLDPWCLTPGAGGVVPARPGCRGGLHRTRSARYALTGGHR